MTDWRTCKRRRYSDAFKRQVVAEASEDGVSASSVARRHGLNTNLVFNWRRRFGANATPTFIPAVIVPEEDALESSGAERFIPRSTEAVRSDGTMEVVCHGGRRIVLAADFDARALVRLLSLVEER